MKIGKPVKYEGRKYWVGAVHDAMIGLQRKPGCKDHKLVSRNAIDKKAVK